MGKKKKINKRFKVHAVLEVDDIRKLELMFNVSLEQVTVRAVVDGIPQRPYIKSEIFYDSEGAYFLINGSLEDLEFSYVKFYLDNFKRVRG